MPYTEHGIYNTLGSYLVKDRQVGIAVKVLTAQIRQYVLW